MPISTINSLGLGGNISVANGTVTVTSATVVDFSSASGGFILPRGTTAQRPASPTNGHMRFNTDSGLIENYTGATGWSQVGQDLTTFNSLNTEVLSHSVKYETIKAGSTKISNYPNGASASRTWSTQTDSFGLHGGHDGVSVWPLYWSVAFTSARAVNRIRINLHGNCFGYFTFQGSNNAVVSGSTWYTTGDWTNITWTATGSTFSVQNMGGTSSGYADGTIITNCYINNVGYQYYRIVFLDNARPNMSQGSSYNGSALYGISLDRT